MWKSTLAEAWRAEGQRDMLVEMIQVRYPSLAPELLAAIRATTDAKAIRRHCLAFARTASQGAFEAALANESRMEGQRDMLLKMIEVRYPSLAPELLEAIKASTDAKAILRWSIALVKAADQAAFEAALANGRTKHQSPA
jgi:hypothetical protein